ncbi:hypothetical protein [Miltoncostaea marina]|uniref:hypothetical protein n=1 Tax=Miltoncostaea marina TaxID=2843215 RepID=UPI001C3C2A18|nr:hypothetical protein [Miltoncostaea marina]
MRPETLLAGLPRLVRVADETRWRGQCSVAAALVVAAFWACTWLLGEPVRPDRTALAAAASAVPPLVAGTLGGARRVRRTLLGAVRPPRSTLHETLAASRDRRMRLASVVLTGIVALLLFDHFTGGGGVMAGLVAGLLAGLGASDWVESHRWESAERERETRIFVIVRPDALSPRLAPQEVYETPRPGAGRERRHEPSPFDLEI